MAINIKNTEVDRLINEIRKFRGQGPTEIVKTALEREYRELRKLRRQTHLAEHLPTLQVTAQQKANDFDPNALYNETGLPE